MSDILVIKLSALGDFVQAIGPFRAIRAHHPDAHITLLTTKPYYDLARALGVFDAIWLDQKPKAWQLGKIRQLRAQLQTKDWDRVYDLQTSDRSSGYYRLLASPKPDFSGIARGCSLPHDNPRRDFMHTMDRQAEQLQLAGIRHIPPPDFGFADGKTLDRFDLPNAFVLMVPGGAATRPLKRWPVDRYRAVAEHLVGQGLKVLAIGTKAEGDVLETLSHDHPGIRAIIDQTSFIDILALGRRAKGAIGNDTGPMHLLAASGCPSLVLFSNDSDPALCAPRGPAVQVLQQPNLADLGVDPVLEAFHRLTGQ